MFCTRCGTANADNGTACLNCGEPLQGTLAPEKIDNNLILAILVTVCCCLPFGLVGVVYAAQVNATVRAGDVVGARDLSRKARLWSLCGLGIGLFVYGCYFLLVLAGALGAEGL